jgi:signal transduction histidine kinase
MEDYGSLSLKLTPMKLPGNLLSISDNSVCGISENLSRLFEPYFTAKKEWTRFRGLQQL